MDQLKELLSKISTESKVDIESIKTELEKSLKILEEEKTEDKGEEDDMTIEEGHGGEKFCSVYSKG